MLHLTGSFKNIYFFIQSFPNLCTWWLSHRESTCQCRRHPETIPGSGRSPQEGNGNPLQYSCLGNPMDRDAWWATVHGVAKSQTWLSDWTTTTKMAQMSTVPKSLIYLKIKHKLQGNIFIKHFSDYKKSKISWDMETKRQWLQYLQSWTVLWF